MVIYSIDVTSLIIMLIDKIAHKYRTTLNVWLTQIISHCWKSARLQRMMEFFDSKSGYYLELLKTRLVVKSISFENGNNLFSGPQIKITSEGHIYLGRNSRHTSLKTFFVKKKTLTNNKRMD